MMEAGQSHNSDGYRTAFKAASAKRKSKKKSSPRVTLRLTDDEFIRLKKAAQGVSLSSYIRKNLFGNQTSLRKTRSRAPVKDSQALAQILGKLGQTRIANNLNQIAYQANAGSLLMDELTEQEINIACAQIAWMRVKLIEALGLKSPVQNKDAQK